MENFKKLSRKELKNTFGGLRGCKLVVALSDGSYRTYSGICTETVRTYYDSLSDSFLSFPSGSYCNTGDGVAHTLSSNGGQSSC
jgi:hypothetical protein